MTRFAVLSFCMPLVAVFSTGCPVVSVQFPPDLRADRWEPEPTGWWDSGTTRPPTLPPASQGLVDSLSVGCTPSGAWLSELRTFGWTSAAELVLRGEFEGSVAYETHPMNLVETDPDGLFDRFTLGPMAAGRPVEEASPSVASRFPCDAGATSAVLTRNRVGEIVDCVVVGPDLGAIDAHLIDQMPASVVCRRQ